MTGTKRKGEWASQGTKATALVRTTLTVSFDRARTTRSDEWSQRTLHFTSKKSYETTSVMKTCDHRCNQKGELNLQAAYSSRLPPIRTSIGLVRRIGTFVNRSRAIFLTTTSALSNVQIRTPKKYSSAYLGKISDS